MIRPKVVRACFSGFFSECTMNADFGIYLIRIQRFPKKTYQQGSSTMFCCILCRGENINTNRKPAICEQPAATRTTDRLRGWVFVSSSVYTAIMAITSQPPASTRTCLLCVHVLHNRNANVKTILTIANNATTAVISTACCCLLPFSAGA